MAADLTNPFAESCCDGGICSINDNSARSCGCDPGAKWVCQQHQTEQRIREEVERESERLRELHQHQE